MIHCTATKQHTSVQSILNYWKNVKKWKSPGYFALIDIYGKVHWLADQDAITNGCKGYNSKSVHIAYIGGINEVTGNPKDTKTHKQICTIISLLKALKNDYPDAKIVGHNEKNKHKDCPSFCTKTFLKNYGISN